MEKTTSKTDNKAKIILKSMWFLEDNYKSLVWRCSHCGKILKEADGDITDLDGNVDVEAPTDKQCPCCSAEFDGMGETEEYEIGYCW